MSRDAHSRLRPGAADLRDREAAEAKFWDVVAAGEPVRSGEIPPDLAEIAEHLFRLDDAPLPDVAFGSRLERELLGYTPPTHLIPVASGARAGTPASGETHAGAGWVRVAPRRAVMNLAATAALVAIIAASIVVTLRADSVEVRDSTTDARVIQQSIGEERLLVDARFDRFPEGILSAVVDRWVLQPGAELVVGSQESGGVGPSAYLIEAGTLSVQPDGPIVVTPAGARSPTEAAAASKLELNAGDRGYSPSGVSALWRNDGDTPVRILEARIRKGDVAVLGDGVLHYTVISESPIARPEFPIVMSVYQVTLKPGADLVASTVPGLEMLKVEQGRLVAVDIDGVGSSSAPVNLGQATRLLESFPPGRVFRSGNGEPVSLLLVTISGDSPLAATPRMEG